MTKLTQFILEIYEQHLKQQTDLFETFAKYFNNDNIDVEERWQVYIKVNKLLPTMNLDAFKKLIDEELLYLMLRENYIYKYKTFKFENLIDCIEDYKNGYEYEDEVTKYLSNLSSDIIKLKCMKSGYSGVEIVE